MMKPICVVVCVQRTAVWQVSPLIQLCKNNEFCINSKTAAVNYLLISYNDGVRTAWASGMAYFKMSRYCVLVTACGIGV